MIRLPWLLAALFVLRCATALAPCDDFTAFSCENEDHERARIENNFFNDAIPILKAYEIDDVTAQLLEFAKEHKYADASALSRLCAAKVPMSSTEQFALNEVFGFGSPVKSFKFDLKLKLIRDEKEEERYDSFTLLPWEETPPDYKEITKAYLKAIDIDRKYDISEFRVLYATGKLRRPRAADLDEQKESKIPEKRNYDFYDDPFAELARNANLLLYANFLYVHILLHANPNLVHNEALVKEIKKLVFLVRDEINAQINATTWISDKNKRSLESIFHKDSFDLGPSAAFLNVKMVDRALVMFQRVFRKHHDDKEMFARIGDDFAGDCRAYYYMGLFNLAYKAFQLENDNFDFGINPYSPHSYFGFSPYNKHDVLVFTASSLSGFSKVHPAPFVYGRLLFLIGHELFHSFGINNVQINGGWEIEWHPNFKKAKQCYADFYGSFGIPEERFAISEERFNKTALFPDGTYKANEGFADVQAMRTLLRIVKKMLRDEDFQQGRRGKYPLFGNGPNNATDETNLRHFFEGAGTMFCSPYWEQTRDVRVEFNALNMAHPRSKIRMNAVVMQVKEFSDLYNCRPGDQMFHVNEFCEGYPV